MMARQGSLFAENVAVDPPFKDKGWGRAHGLGGPADAKRAVA